MGFIDGDAAWYAQEMARRAANRAAQEAAREQERIDRERYESSSRSGYGSWAKGPAPSGNMFANLTMDELIRKRNQLIEDLKADQLSGNGSREHQTRELLGAANHEIDYRNNFDVLSKTERAEIKRLASKQNEELRKERDALRTKLNDLSEQMRRSFHSLEVSLGYFEVPFREIEWDIINIGRCECQFGRNQSGGITEAEWGKCPKEGVISKARHNYDEAEKLFRRVLNDYYAVRKQLGRLEAAASSTDGHDSSASSS